MKKISISVLAFGLAALLLGIISNQLLTEDFSIRLIKQLSLSRNICSVTEYLL